MYLLFANIVDIRQINADGKKSETLLQEPRGSIIALDYDPVQKQVKDHTHAWRLLRLRRPIHLWCVYSCPLVDDDPMKLRAHVDNV